MAGTIESYFRGKREMRSATGCRKRKDEEGEEGDLRVFPPGRWGEGSLTPSEIRTARVVPTRRVREPQGPQEQMVLAARPARGDGKVPEAKGKGNVRAEEVEGRGTRGGRRGEQHQGGRVQ